MEEEMWKQKYIRKEAFRKYREMSNIVKVVEKEYGKWI